MRPIPPESPMPPQAAHWAAPAAYGRPASRRRSATRRAAAWLLGILFLLLLAAWGLPPLLDWGSCRTAIAAIAAARLGRPVVIAGDISLRLLPDAILTAAEVTLPDQGDGVSGQVGALRLQVATLPLLAGRIVPRELVLGTPVLRLPWRGPGKLPASLAHPSRPVLPHPFAARIENGVLRIGQTEITGITAAIHGGPGAIQAEPGVPGADPAPVATFGAEGFAGGPGRTWRFTAALGGPDADGVSAVDISVRGQGQMAGTGGTLQGTLAEGVVQGRLRAGGPDLSRLLPAAAQPWQADAPFVASSDQVETSAITLSLGSAPAEGALRLNLAAPARLEGALHAASLDLDGWARLLDQGAGLPSGWGAPGFTPQLRIDLAADTATLLGGKLHALHATLVADDGQLGLDRAEAVLPGNALLTAARVRPSSASGPGGVKPPALTSPVHLDAPDLRATIGWLRKLAPGLVAALPDGVLRTAALAGQASLGRDGVGLAGLTGRIDGAMIAGDAAIRPRRSPALTASLAIDRLDLDGWLDGRPAVPSLAALGRRASVLDTELHLRAAHGAWHGLALDALVLDARTGPLGLALAEARTEFAGSRLSLAGTLGPDGRLTDARITLATPELAALARLPPPAWRLAPGLWHGPGALRLTADGPPDALALQLRVDAGDLVLEADSLRNTLAGTASATLTLRHPGAPRLLAGLGLPGGMDAAVDWLQTGSLALRAHLLTRPGHATLEDFDLAAASLRLGGHLDADWSAAGTDTLSGTLAAEQLALPAPALWQDLPAAAGWTGRLHVTARALTIGGAQAAQNMSADLAAADGAILVDNMSGSVAGGHLTGQLAADLAAPRFAARLVLADLPAAPLGGSLDAALDLASASTAPSTLSGTAQALLRGVTLPGFPVPGAALSGILQASVTGGRLTLTSRVLTSPLGQVGAAGGADLAAATVDVHLEPQAGAGMRLSGHLGALQVQPDLPVKREARHGKRKARGSF